MTFVSPPLLLLCLAQSYSSWSPLWTFVSPFVFVFPYRYRIIHLRGVFLSRPPTTFARRSRTNREERGERISVAVDRAQAQQIKMGLIRTGLITSWRWIIKGDISRLENWNGWNWDYIWFLLDTISLLFSFSEGRK